MLLASGCSGGRVCVWDVRTGTLLAAANLQAPRAACGVHVAWLTGSRGRKKVAAGTGAGLWTSAELDEDCGGSGTALLTFEAASPAQANAQQLPLLLPVQEGGACRRRLVAVAHERSDEPAAALLSSVVCITAGRDGFGGSSVCCRDVIGTRHRRQAAYRSLLR
jgi:hypothetical protein